MRRHGLVGLLLTTMLLVGAGCGDDRVVAPPSGAPGDDSPVGAIDPDQAARELALAAGWAIEEAQAQAEKSSGGGSDASPNCVVTSARTAVTADVAHYEWRVRIGSGPHDFIGLHRVVKERRPGVPIRAQRAMFLQHGDAKNFTGMFLPGTLSAATPDDFGAAVFWARHDIDVWGIDQAWNLVPAETVDFGFMANWGIDKQSRDLGLALAMARAVRVLTGCGCSRLTLLGYSSGSATGYAALNAEAQRPPALRQVANWIAVDYSPISDNEEWNQIANCGYVPFYQDMLDRGEYGYFVGFDYLGNLARNDPGGESPVFPGFTNLQAAMYMGAGQIFGVGDIHYLAGIWENDLPVAFQFVTLDQWLDFMIAGAPWEPVRFMLDYCVWSCPSYDAPWDDHFAEITVPVLNVAAAGGVGPTTYWCLSQLGSTDVTRLDVQLRPEGEALYDYGHIDLWIASNSQQLVWEPILDWVLGHTADRDDAAPRVAVGATP